MDRNIVYPASIPLDTDLLNANRNAMIALGYLAQAVLGTGTVADGLACGPTSPTSMGVVVGAGSIFTLSTVDTSGYGSLALDTDICLKQGINTAPTPFTLTAPATGGQSIVFLIEGQFVEGDDQSVVLPYYNSSNPAIPYTGPGNSGSSQVTRRRQRVSLQVKAGTAATTGYQTVPAADGGWVPLWAITVASGQTVITSGNIVAAPGAPFVATKLPQFSPVASPQVFTAAGSIGTITLPAGVPFFEIEAVGGAGGGGGASSGQAGGGGGAGATGRKRIAVVSGVNTVTGTVGVAGAGGASGVSGTAGGATSITYNGITYTANGGAGGVVAASPAGGNGGTVSGFDENLPGGWGGDGSPSANTMAGSGGASSKGGGGRGAASGGTPAIGTAPGSGGGGSYNAASAGGSGAAGQIKISY